MFRDSLANFKTNLKQILTCPICSSFPNFNILQFLKTHPYFDPIGGDPRFAELVRRAVAGDPNRVQRSGALDRGTMIAMPFF
jgi:hypothetical protein